MSPLVNRYHSLSFGDSHCINIISYVQLALVLVVSVSFLGVYLGSLTWARDESLSGLQVV